MNKKNWRSNARYVDQYPEKPTFKTVEKRKKYHKTFYICEKYICVHKRTGNKTCGIIFSNGKVRIGSDVWRLSCTTDCCEYPVIGYHSRTAAEEDYEFQEANSSLLFYLTDEKENPCNEEVMLV